VILEVIKMKNKFLVVVLIMAIFGLEAMLLNQGNKPDTKNNLPPSLDQYYNTQPPEYLIKKFELGESLMGVIMNSQQGDLVNAKKSFIAFSKEYKDIADMVPEWRKYYDPKTVENLGAALDSRNASAVLGAAGGVAENCAKCHTENMPAVWNRYNWKNFNNVMISTPEGQLPWAAAKMKYLVIGFDGIGVNIKKGDQAAAQQSFNLFKSMFSNLTAACSSCHISERRYYVSEDIQTMVNDMGANITSGNLSKADRIREIIGMESCYRCHVLHMPAQFMKESPK
jgi:cytochrome c556